MAKKTTSAFPRVDYSNINVFVEEAIHIENHRPAIVVVKKKKPVIRIIPSKKWTDDVENLSGLLSHESLHVWLGVHFGEEATKKLDNLPEPKNAEEYMSGVFGWGLKKFPETNYAELTLEEVESLK